jgi:hypothetical protein
MYISRPYIDVPDLPDLVRLRSAPAWAPELLPLLRIPLRIAHRGRFPHRLGSGLTWQTQRGLLCQLQFCSGETMTPPRFGGWRGRRRTAIRPDGCSHWRRSVKSAVVAMLQSSAVSGCRQFVTGCCGSMPRVLRLDSRQERWASVRSSPRYGAAIKMVVPIALPGDGSVRQGYQDLGQ